MTDTDTGLVPEPAPDDGDGPLLVVESLSTTFRTDSGRIRAVDDVSLILTRGRTLGIVGESGSGKSVLARSIMGLVPGYADRTGSIRFDGVEMTTASTRQLRELWGARMAMVFQDPMTALNPVQRIGNQITESLREHLDYDRGRAKQTAIALLTSVGIPEPARRLREYPHQLSGGMRQRVVIAIALACGPSLLFADEPTTALDVTVQAQILDLLAEQQRERYMAMILVTHDLGVVATRADDIAVMYAGQIVEQAPARSLFHEMRHPYTEALMRSIPRRELASHTRLEAISGRPPDLANPPVGCRFADRCSYAQDKCRAEQPPLISDGDPAHLYRCWFPVSISARDAASDEIRPVEVADLPPPTADAGEPVDLTTDGDGDAHDATAIDTGAT